ncbi:putative tetratricopeptide-like helical domain superfamily [Dioscorea sansibarensis]
MNAVWENSTACLPKLNTHSRPKAIIFTLCKHGRFMEALQCLCSNPSTFLDLPTYSALLQFCINSNAHARGRALHDHLIAIGCTSDLFLNTKLIIFYAKLGDLTAARKVFDTMPQRSVVSWTAMISGYSQNQRPSESLGTFILMQREGLRANQFTYGSVLRACKDMGCIRSGEQIHGRVAKSRFAEDLFVQSALLDLHLKCGSVGDARCLFGWMKHRDLVSWNSVIGGHAVRGLGHDAFELFCLMMRDDMSPDHFTFGHVLRACAGIKNLEIVSQIHSFIIRSGYGNHCVVSGSLIDAYAKCKCMTSARLLYGSLLEHDLVSCTALITGYSQEKNFSVEAFELFYNLNQIGMRFDDVILCSMLNICANGALLSLGRQIHACISKTQPAYDVALGNALIDMYAKAGEIENAHCLFDGMRYKNVISWTSLIAAYGKHGYGEVAISLFVRMEEYGFKPNDVTFLSLLSACSHSGLTSKGMDYFHSMVRKYGVHPRAEHYSCVVDLLARGGLIKEAFDFVHRNKIEPSTSAWGAMLGACRTHGYVVWGEASAKYLFHLEPGRSVNYVILANIYAAAGLWENALNTRKLLDERSMKKDAGCSLI